MGKISIGRPINGISLNGLEYLLTDSGKVMLFDNVDKAKDFLKANGYSDYTDEQLEDNFIFNTQK